MAGNNIGISFLAWAGGFAINCLAFLLGLVIMFVVALFVVVVVAACLGGTVKAWRDKHE